MHVDTQYGKDLGVASRPVAAGETEPRYAPAGWGGESIISPKAISRTAVQRRGVREPSDLRQTVYG